MGSGVQLKLLDCTGSTILPAPEITYSPIPGIWPDLVMEIGSWKAQQKHIVAKYQPIKPIKYIDIYIYIFTLGAIER